MWSFGVPNVPCGVESKLLQLSPQPLLRKFLMYRVELKETTLAKAKTKKRTVPNVPCGVESRVRQRFVVNPPIVPNVPCGVESLFRS